MAPTIRRTNSPLINQVSDEPYAFEYFQLVRILERMRNPQGNLRSPVGMTQNPDEEAVRFRTLVAASFPPSDVYDLTFIDTTTDRAFEELEHESSNQDTSNPKQAGLPRVDVTFMGLTGPHGALPEHYTAMMISQMAQIRAADRQDFAMRDFFDLFNHRVISLFYRAWEKHFFPVAYERTQIEARQQARQDTVRQHPKEDKFTRLLYSLVGMASPGFRKQLTIDDQVILRYAGLFADSRRPAKSLERMLADFFEMPCTIEQFRGSWLRLDPNATMSRLPGATTQTGTRLGGTNNRLPGKEDAADRYEDAAVLGGRVWDIGSRFRIKLGPMSFKSFCSFLPNRVKWQAVNDLVRLYVGPEFDYEIQPILQQPEIPQSQLIGDREDRPMLGGTAWAAAKPAPKDFDAATFQLHDQCNRYVKNAS